MTGFKGPESLVAALSPSSEDSTEKTSRTVWGFRPGISSGFKVTLGTRVSNISCSVLTFTGQSVAVVGGDFFLSSPSVVSSGGEGVGSNKGSYTAGKATTVLASLSTIVELAFSTALAMSRAVSGGGFFNAFFGAAVFGPGRALMVVGGLDFLGVIRTPSEEDVLSGPTIVPLAAALAEVLDWARGFARGAWVVRDFAGRLTTGLSPGFLASLEGLAEAVLPRMRVRMAR